MATLEELEKEIWSDPEDPTPLIAKCHRLRKKDISEFTIEELRILIGQAIGQSHLIPLALAVLEQNPLAEGDFYPGDLLAALVRQTNWSALESWTPRIEAVCRSALANPAADETEGFRPTLEAYLNRRSHSH